MFDTLFNIGLWMGLGFGILCVGLAFYIRKYHD